MKISDKSVEIFKIANRSGFAAICGSHLTEGKTKQEAYSRMVKAVKRTLNRKKNVGKG